MNSACDSKPHAEAATRSRPYLPGRGDGRGFAAGAHHTSVGHADRDDLLLQCSARRSSALEQSPQFQKNGIGPVVQLASAHGDDSIAERFEKFRPRLRLRRGPRQIDDQRMLRADVIDNERADLALVREVVASQASRPQQLRERLLGRMCRTFADEEFSSRSMSQYAGEHAGESSPVDVAADAQ